MKNIISALSKVFDMSKVFADMETGKRPVLLLFFLNVVLLAYIIYLLSASYEKDNKMNVKDEKFIALQREFRIREAQILDSMRVSTIRLLTLCNQDKENLLREQINKLEDAQKAVQKVVKTNDKVIKNLNNE